MAQDDDFPVRSGTTPVVEGGAAASAKFFASRRSRCPTINLLAGRLPTAARRWVDRPPHRFLTPRANRLAQPVLSPAAFIKLICCVPGKRSSPQLKISRYRPQSHSYIERINT